MDNIADIERLIRVNINTSYQIDTSHREVVLILLSGSFKVGETTFSRSDVFTGEADGFCISNSGIVSIDPDGECEICIIKSACVSNKIIPLTRFDKKYSDLDPSLLPASECLKDTVDRFLPYWDNSIKPDLQKGKKILIVAHGNSLRALVKYIDKIDDKEILGLNIPTGAPLVYELNSNLNPIKSYYLGDEEEMKKRAAEVAAQGSTK